MPTPSRPHVYAVSELNKLIKHKLEDLFPFLWISGEISNLRIPSSGHCYFTLKDPYSQLSAVMFRTQIQSLKFKPEDGLAIIGLGRISVYEPRGSYQVIFEYLEPKGIGGLQIAFEKLKQKLAEEGLFDARHKLQLPVLPKKISVVTSPTGAAIRDFIKVAQRRFANLPLEVVSVAVQGDRAPGEIIHAIRMLNEIKTTDLIVLARGGGSIEDLCAFNDEQVARAIFASKIPIISAIGHETDYTIADFVADLRAPTPSAAAEIAVPAKDDFENQLNEINRKLYQTINNLLKNLKKQINQLVSRIKHPRRRLQDSRMRLDDYSIRLLAVFKDSLARKRERVAFRRDRLMHASPLKGVVALKEHVMGVENKIVGALNRLLQDKRAAIVRHAAMLEALHPMAILQRGYSITRSLPDRSIVRCADGVKIDQNLEVLLGKGKLMVTVTKKGL